LTISRHRAAGFACPLIREFNSQTVLANFNRI
jgi:hypothetical protein